MRKLLSALAFLLAPSICWAQCSGTFAPNTYCGNNGASPAPPAQVSASGSILTNLTPSVVNNTALLASCTSTSGCPGGGLVFPNGVWRLTFGNGNGAEPLWYNPSTLACTIAAGNGDNGLQVKSADNKCWIAAFPSSGASILQFGAIGDGSTDNTTVIQNAITDLPSNGYKIIVPRGVTGSYCVFTGLTIPANPNAGFATNLGGYSAQSSGISACNHDVTLLTSHGDFAFIHDLIFTGRGSSSTDTFVFTKPTLNIQGGNTRLSNLVVIGGTNTILFNDGANSIVVDNVFALNAYGSANILMQGGSAYFIRDQFDQTWPGTVIDTANATFSARANGTLYAANTVVTLSGYYIQATVGGTSGGSPPALKPYGANIIDGTVTWQLLAPITYAGVQCDTGCAGSSLIDVDLAGPYSPNLLYSNSLAGGAPVGNFVKDATFSFGIGNVIQATAGGQLQIKGGTISGCALSGCTGIVLANSWLGPATVTGMQTTGSIGFGVTNEAGSNFIYTGNSLPAGRNNEILISNGASNFVIANNVLAQETGGITVAAGASDFYNIVNNIISGGTIVDGGTGTHKTISGNN